MADLPDMQFPPGLDEIELRPELADTLTANSLQAFSRDPHADTTQHIPCAEPSDGLIPQPQTPAPTPKSGDHVTPVNGTYAFSPAFDEIDNLVDVWYLMNPDIKLYPWQKQELLRISGYVDGVKNENRVHFTPQEAFRAALCCCNGSGKDLTLIATVAVGLPLLYLNVIVVITSASHEQLKYQTENHIKRGIANLHKNLGGLEIYDSVEFYHKCEKRGSEIKLFVTDEGGRAEGWHPFHPTGRLVLIINEAKSINPDVFDALDRCDGYSHWLEISSPGPRSGLFYDNFIDAVQYPAKPEKGKFFARKVDYTECPHKSEETRLQVLRKHGEHSYIYQTSYLANFYEQEEDVCIPAILFFKNRHIEPVEDSDDIGIGLDSAAGRDETSVHVRAGAMHKGMKNFVQKDTEATADIIDEYLHPWKNKPYIFKADDGGVSRGIIDKLVARGWDVTRHLNQSPAFQKTLYLNLGAEMYFHVAHLLEIGAILPPNDPILRKQLSTRKYSETENQGKKSLESKKAMKGRSPDRADGYVLCYFSYRPPNFRAQKPKTEVPKRLMTIEQFLAESARDSQFIERLIAQHNTPKEKGDFTFQTLKI